MKIAIVGGGPVGLMAAWRLTQKGHQVIVFEKETKLGGLASSFKANSWDWPLERYFHHYFSSDRGVKKLARELGLEKDLFYLKPKTSVYLDGRIFRFDNPQSLLSFPKLNLIDKLRTGLTTLFLKLNPFWQPLEKISAATFIKKTMGKRPFQLIWQPLLESKFGAFAPQIPASWFWTRIKKRSFALGYFTGGTETLFISLSEAIKKNGGQILFNQAVTRIEKKPSGFTLHFQNRPEKDQFDKVMVTVSPAVLAKIAPDLNQDEVKELASFKSLGSLCLVLALKESFLADGTYWLNINDSRFPFVAVVEQTNFIEKKHYCQQVLLYVGGYYPTDHPFFHRDKGQLLKKFQPYLKKINPVFDFKQNLTDYWLFKDHYSQPIIAYHSSQRKPSSRTSIPGLFWASLHHVYPEDRGVNYAILLGEKISDEIIKS
jgi:protoporphyrinogen oxidase